MYCILSINFKFKFRTLKNYTTIYDLNDDLLRLSQALLGIGHFRYGPLACKMLLGASELKPGYTKTQLAKVSPLQSPALSNI